MCAHVPASVGRQWKDGWSSFSGPCSGQAVPLTQRSRDGWSCPALPALLAIHRPPTAAWEAIAPLNMCCSKLVFLVHVAVAEMCTSMVLSRSAHLHVEITSWVTYALKVSWTNWTQYCPGYNLCRRPLRHVFPAQTGKLTLSSCGRSCHVNLFMSTPRGKVLSCPSRLGCAVGTGSVGEETCPSPCACSQQVGWRGSLCCVHIYLHTRMRVPYAFKSSLWSSAPAQLCTGPTGLPFLGRPGRGPSMFAGPCWNRVQNNLFGQSISFFKLDEYRLSYTCYSFTSTDKITCVSLWFWWRRGEKTGLLVAFLIIFSPGTTLMFISQLLWRWIISGFRVYGCFDVCFKMSVLLLS